MGYKMKRITMTVFFSMIGILLAQGTPTIMRCSYMKVNKGKEAAFEKAVTSHVSRWHGIGQWNQYGWVVETGSRTGQYFVGTLGHYWEDFDERITTKEHDNDWKRISNAYVDDDNGGSGLTFWNYAPELSYNNSASSKIAFTTYHCKANALDSMLEIMVRFKEANEKAMIDVSYLVFKKEAGGPNEVFAVLALMDGYADMAPMSPSIMERYVAAFGKEVWQKDYQTWTNGLKWSETEIMSFLPDLSSTSPE